MYLLLEGPHCRGIEKHMYLAAHSLESGSPQPFIPNKIKKGESLGDFDHVLDMVGRGLQSFDYTLQDHTLVV